ncbi:hypothetical protein [Owenweeksia hongkongensis]|uniref:hypothetical protein n=1 Tax=Owenweeksia hongkongensis TaxID=253245 RepID=UPI003A9089E0
MRENIISIFICFTFLVSCNNATKDNKAEKENYSKLVKAELNSRVKKDTLILGYRFGMTREELKSHTETLLKNKTIQLEGGDLTFQLIIEDKAIPFAFQTKTYNDKLNFLRASTENATAIQVNNYLIDKYGKYIFVDSSDHDILKTTTYHWISGNREITSTQISGGYTSEAVLIYRDQSNQEPINISSHHLNQVKVENSSWDGSVSQVNEYLKQNLKDPKSYESIEWSDVQKVGDNYRVRHKYRAKNSYGGYMVENQIFTINSQGKIIDVQNL